MTELPPVEVLAQRIREQRRSSGRRQTVVAEHAGVSPATLSRFELGEIEMAYSTIEDILDQMDIDCRHDEVTIGDEERGVEDGFRLFDAVCDDCGADLTARVEVHA